MAQLYTNHNQVVFPLRNLEKMETNQDMDLDFLQCKEMILIKNIENRSLQVIWKEKYLMHILNGFMKLINIKIKLSSAEEKNFS